MYFILCINLKFRTQKSKNSIKTSEGRRWRKVNVEIQI